MSALQKFYSKTRKCTAKQRDSNEINDYCLTTTEICRADMDCNLKHDENVQETEATVSQVKNIEDTDQIGQFNVMFPISDYNNMDNDDMHRDVEQQNKCSKCPAIFTAPINLKRHMERQHSDKPKLKCNHCEYQTSRRDHLNAHLHTHGDTKPYDCKLCDRSYVQARDLKIHIIQKHSDIKLYYCEKCDHSFAFKRLLDRHVKSRHTDVKEFKCAHCEYETNIKKYLITHMITHGNKLFKCKRCKHSFKRKYDLKRHIKDTHTEKKEFECADCGYGTNHRDKLQRHAAKHEHTEEKELQCGDCNYKTNHRDKLQKHLNKHIQNKHAEEKEEKKKDTKRKLEVDSDGHPEIDNSKKRKYDLKQRIKDKRIEEKEFQCAHCSYKTNYKNILQRHLRKHKFEVASLCHPEIDESKA